VAIRTQGVDSNLSKDITRIWAIALMSLERYAEAMSRLQQVAESETRLSGQMKIATAMLFAILVRRQGRYPEALEAFNHAISLAQGDPAPDDLHSLMSCRAELVYYYLTLGDWENAAKTGELLWPEQVKLLGDQHPDTNTTLHYLARALSKLGDFEKAERLQRKVCDNFLLTIGSDHPSFLGTQAYLGWTLWCQGRLDEAESYYRFAMDGFIRKPLSEIDAYTILWALACILRDGGAAHVARYEIAKYISSLEEQDIESEAPFCDRVENVAQKCFSLDMKDCF
jgi:tetratricopeptide (TPR) repeat protein